MYFFCSCVYFAGSSLVMKNYEWKVFILLTTLPSVPLVPEFLWLPGSIRYLQNIGCFEKVVKVLHKISMLIKKEMPKKFILKVNIENISRRYGSRIAEKQNLLIVIKASVAFLAALVMYYSVSFLTTKIFIISNKRTYDLLTKRDYFEILVIALADILRTFILALIADKFRHKTLLTIYFTLVGIFRLCHLHQCFRTFHSSTT